MNAAAAPAAAALGRRNLVLVGFMGAGKSTLGRAAARALGRRFVDADAEVEARAGLPVPEIFARDGEAAFRDLEAAVLADAAARGAQVIATGGGALGRPGNVTALRRHGVLVLLAARPEVVLRRVGGHQAAARRPLLAGSDPLARIRALLEQRQPWYDQADLRLDTSDLTAEAAVSALLALCAQRCGEIRRG